MSSRISVRNLSFGYGKTNVIKELTCEIGEGRLIALIGPNGAGKSTFFKCLLGFLKGYTGDILLDGVNIRTMNRSEVAKRIAYIPQSSIPVFNYTVGDSVLMGTTGGLGVFDTPREEQVLRAERALKELGIWHLKDRGISHISGGERQLAMIARAMAQDAKIIIMDEPTANLDYGNQYRVMTGIKSLTGEGYTVLVATHNPEHALLFADEVLVMKDGCFARENGEGGVLDENMMKTLYDIDVKILEADIDGEKKRVILPYTK